jgi:hypothetical protein
MTSIDSDYQLSQLHYERQVELIDAIKYHQLQKPFYELERKGVRTEILEELMMSQNLKSSRPGRADQHHRKWDLADQLDTARNAA